VKTNKVKYTNMRLTQKRTALMLITSITLLVMACNNNKNQENTTEQNNSSLFPKGDKLSNEWFTGTAF
jgi:hypothetical protein